MKRTITIVVKGLLLWLLCLGYSFAQETKDITFLVEKFTTQGTSPLDQADIDSILQPYQHKEYNLNSLQDVAKTLEKAIRAQGYAFYRVV
ncbi:MAG: hypothetical protein KAR12_06255, partial [Methylococcales bacterium]|nr:hypothetical protein [Methylococcales bacterium]